MKDLMAVISGSFGKRFTARQKERFVRYMRNWAQKHSIKCVLDEKRLGFGFCRNIYLGDLKRAELLLAIPYDTSTRILWPGIRYYPVHKEKNVFQETISNGLNVLLAAAVIVGYYFLVFSKPSFTAMEENWKLAGLLLCSLLVGKILFGWGNRNNYARNDASIVIALEYLKRSLTGRAAIALLDHSCCGFQGYRQMYEYLEKKGWKKKILILDCVCSGNEFHLYSLETLPQLPKKLVHRLTADEATGTIFELLPSGVLLTGGQQCQGETVVVNTRSGRDCQINLNKMEEALKIIRQVEDAMVK